MILVNVMMFSLYFFLSEKKTIGWKTHDVLEPPSTKQASCFARRGMLRSGGKRLRKGSAMDARLATSDGAEGSANREGETTRGVTRVDFFLGEEQIFLCLKCRLKVKVIMIFGFVDY